MNTSKYTQSQRKTMKRMQRSPAWAAQKQDRRDEQLSREALQQTQKTLRAHAAAEAKALEDARLAAAAAASEQA